MGEWQPSLTISVVVPAYGGQDKLDLTLAALAAQSYPSHLTEVVVVDDGTEPPLRLPALTPENTRLIRAEPDGWGSAHAFHTGALASEGEVIQRVDADMVLFPAHLEALMRWQHQARYLVTIGYKRFLPFESDRISPDDVYPAPEKAFDLTQGKASSTEATIEKLDMLRSARNPYHVCTGPTMSLRRSLYTASGGADPAMILGGDTEFAFRLAQAGAAFVPEPLAQAVHLGLPALRDARRERLLRCYEPYLAHRVPQRRELRKERGRRWLVPWADVVVDVTGATSEQVRATAASFAEEDVRLTLVAPWPDPRRRPAGPLVDEPGLELRLIRETFDGDGRVRLVSDPGPVSAPIPFRLICPAGWTIDPGLLPRLLAEADERRDGVIDFGEVRLERTSAVSRALLLREPGEPLDTVIDAVHGVRSAELPSTRVTVPENENSPEVTNPMKNDENPGKRHERSERKPFWRRGR
ncbi:glycosyltransferase [Rhizohabitans arisaemae]|uniref:glycosyltransferase n=1 Tax=Rhizohabitans arisaemae TaxID=2720610 RepID=UPI0024B088FC|nr:glycosyltransferase family 2 protein [Rhizohabitans arisaemae]